MGSGGLGADLLHDMVVCRSDDFATVLARIRVGLVEPGFVAEDLLWASSAAASDFSNSSSLGGAAAFDLAVEDLLGIGFRGLVPVGISQAARRRRRFRCSVAVSFSVMSTVPDPALVGHML